MSTGFLINNVANNSKISLIKLVPFLFIAALLNSFFVTNAQADELAAYKKTIHERSAKIANSLGILSKRKYKKVVHTISNQYFFLNSLQKKNEQDIASVKLKKLSIEEEKASINTLKENMDKELEKQHTQYIKQLNKRLLKVQVEGVKDAMTYNVMPNTYKAFQEMIPTLTDVQKKQIYEWLYEAREKAMDQGSSDAKHAMFGKYKGRINNYLAAQGYDLKKEGDAWQKRIKQKESKN